MQRVLVTGGNKGVGYGICKVLLDRGCFVLLGSRDVARGTEAVNNLLQDNKSFSERLELLQIDVSDPSSVQKAAAEVSSKFGASHLDVVVNNAGVGSRTITGQEMMQTNLVGIKLVSDAFIPLLNQTSGRIVNVTSAAGPMFVAKCSEERQNFFRNADLTWEQIQSVMNEIVTIDHAEMEKHGFGDWSQEPSFYGSSKALANCLSMLLAKQYPHLKINACTPGFIETDMTKGYMTRTGKTAAELGMKSPLEGALAPVMLALDPVEGSGRFYGSDGVRSPLDRYRSPGEPPYEGP